MNETETFTPLQVEGTLTLKNVSTRDFSRLVTALDSWNPIYLIWFKGYGATREGNICFFNTSWHLVLIGKTPTERKQFFKMRTEENVIEVKPENGVFAELRIEYTSNAKGIARRAIRAKWETLQERTQAERQEV